MEKKICPKCEIPKYLLDFKVLGPKRVSKLCKECRAKDSYPLLQKIKGVNTHRIF